MTICWPATVERPKTNGENYAPSCNLFSDFAMENGIKPDCKMNSSIVKAAETSKSKPEMPARKLRH